MKRQTSTAFLDDLSRRAPLPVAVAFDQLRRDLETEGTSARLALLDLCLAVEATARFHVVLAIAATALEHGGCIPPSLSEKLADFLRGPTLGQLLRILRTLLDSGGEFVSGPAEFAASVEALTELFDPSARASRSPSEAYERDLLSVRNALAHGVQMSEMQTAALLHHWLPLVERALGSGSFICEWGLIAGASEGTICLNGTDPQGRTTELDTPTPFNEVVLRRRAQTFPLRPLHYWGTGSNGRRALHSFARRRSDRLVFDAISSDGPHQTLAPPDLLGLFDTLFSTEALGERRRQRRFQIEGFEYEIAEEARQFVGRDEEMERLVSMVHSHPGAVLWVHGPPGIGKSALMSKAAQVLGGAPELTTLPYRFRVGQRGCSRESFVSWLSERLRDTGATRSIPSPRTFADHCALIKMALANRESRRLAVLVDGLDELARVDPGFVDETLRLILASIGPDVVFAFSSRTEPPIPALMDAIGAIEVYPGGVPPASTTTLRAILERVGSGTTRLLVQGDREESSFLRNRFVETVIERSRGFPFYVQLVARDIEAGRFESLDAQEAARLPTSVEDYLTALCAREEIGDLSTYKTLAALFVAHAQEPLTDSEIADLISRTGWTDEIDQQLKTSQAIASLGSLLRGAGKADGTPGSILFHSGLRDYIRGAPELRAGGTFVRHALVKLSSDPGRGAAATYLFRHGVAHLLEEGKAADAVSLLQQPDYLLERLQTLAPHGGDGGMRNDWHRVRVTNATFSDSAGAWARFWSSEGARFVAGDGRDAARELLEACLRFTAETPLGAAGEHLAPMLHRRPLMVRKAASRSSSIRGAVAILDGHGGTVNGACVLHQGAILSWSDDGTLRRWTPEGALVGHSVRQRGAIRGALETLTGDIVSWDENGDLRRWALRDGLETHDPLAALGSDLRGAIRLPDGQFVCWNQAALLLLDQYGVPRTAAAVRHASSVEGVSPGPTSFFSWTEESLSRHSFDGVVEAHRELPRYGLGAGVLPLTDGGVLVWYHTGMFDRLDPSLQSIGEPWMAHDRRPLQGFELEDRRFASTAEDGHLRIHGPEGISHDASIDFAGRRIQAVRLQSGGFVAWGTNGLPHVFGPALEERGPRGGFPAPVRGSLETNVPRMLSWGGDLLWLWDAEEGQIVTHEDRRIVGATGMSSGRYLSWSNRELHLWNSTGDSRRSIVEEEEQPILDVAPLAGGGFVSRVRSGFHVYDEGGELVARNRVSCNIEGILPLPNHGLITWGDGLRLWDRDGTHLRTAVASRWTLPPTNSGMAFALSIEKFDGTPSFHRAVHLTGGVVAAWTVLGVLQTWTADLTPLCEPVHASEQGINGILPISDSSFFVYGTNGNLRRWSVYGTAEGRVRHAHRYRNHSGVLGALATPGGLRILTWGTEDLRLWTTKSKPVGCPMPQSDIVGAFVLSNGMIISWQQSFLSSPALRLWTAEGAPASDLIVEHESDILGVLELPGKRFVSWSRDWTLRVWNFQGRVQSQHYFDGHPLVVRLVDGGLQCAYAQGTDQLKLATLDL
jgi:WD40 repeat protein